MREKNYCECDMSDCPDWNLHYDNIHELLHYVHETNTKRSFGLYWNSVHLHKAIVDTGLPDGMKSRKEWIEQRIQADYALRKYYKKYYNPDIYHNALPPYPYEIDTFVGWKLYDGDMSAGDITLMPSDTYETVVERVLKKFSGMIALYLRKDWFCRQTRGYVYGINKMDRILRYKEWQKRVHGA